jgi:DNA-binding NarL/FixJ family response regulator
MDHRRISILIADDHSILRAGVKRLLQEMPEISSLGEAADGNQILQLMRARAWDVLLLDLDMPGQAPLDVLRLVRSGHPDTAVLILSMYPEEQFALRAIKAGAAGYVNKQCAPEQLMSAVRRVSEGGTYMSANLASALASSLRTKPRETLDDLLTDREFTVLRGIAAGKSVTDIGHELNLSVKTISTYRARLLSKLNLRTNADLIRYAADHGLVK